MTCGLPTPGLTEKFTPITLAPTDVGVWLHVFSTKQYPTTPESFSEGWGDTRFAPILHDDGTPVHTYYAASTTEAAYMESVLHDIPLAPPGQFSVDELRHFHLVRLEIPGALDCVSFHTPYLPQLNLTRGQLIDSLPVCYPETRAWAQEAYRQCPTAQAIAYGSRRDDAARRIMLFKQRLPDPPFKVLTVESLALGARRDEVLALIRRLGIHEI
jgi:RES domain